MGRWCESGPGAADESLLPRSASVVVRSGPWEDLVVKTVGEGQGRGRSARLSSARSQGFLLVAAAALGSSIVLALDAPGLVVGLLFGGAFVVLDVVLGRFLPGIRLSEEEIVVTSWLVPRRISRSEVAAIESVSWFGDDGRLRIVLTDGRQLRPGVSTRRGEVDRATVRGDLELVRDWGIRVSERRTWSGRCQRIQQLLGVGGSRVVTGERSADSGDGGSGGL